MVVTKSLEVDDPKMIKLQKEKEVAREFQERKHDDWNDNYELYRNKVRTNRLTQRQAVNIPLMKETIKTLLSAIDEPPNIEWTETSGDQMKEIIFQEIWNKSYESEKLDWLDLVDKKNVMLYGLSTKMLNVGDEGPEIDVLDVWDVVYDPLMNPVDVESARFIIRQNIYRSLREILADERYSERGKNALKHWADGEDAMVQSAGNQEEADKRNKRLEAMGVDHSEFNTFSAGDVVINLTEHYTKMWNADTEEWEKHVVVYADDWMPLMDEKLEDLIGIDQWPFVMWAEDPETNDVYPDGIADLVRTPNKFLNVWFSQHVENRTLQNFQMHWYDATVKNYKPQTYEPGPGRMLPAPGNPRETIMPVDINGLEETFTAIEFLTRIVERGSGAVSIEKGVSEQTTQTLGEVEILVGKAQERSIAMQKFYRGAWQELAEKWRDMIHANPPQNITLYRKGTSGKTYEKKVSKKDWEGDYRPEVRSVSEIEASQFQNIQKFNAVAQQYPNNMALQKIVQRRTLELLDLTPGELKEIQDEQEMQMEQFENQQALQKVDQAEQTQVQPTEQDETGSLLQELASL